MQKIFLCRSIILGTSTITTASVAVCQGTEILSKPSISSNMEVNDCISKEGLKSSLTREDQQIILSTNAIKTTIRGGEIEKNIFTSRPDFKIGFHFIQKVDGSYCKAATLHSIKILNTSVGSIDQRAYTSPKFNAPTGSLNYAIDLAFRKTGELPIFQATSEATRRSPEVIITIFRTMADNTQQKSDMVLSLKSGEAYGVLPLKQTAYSKAALEFLSRQ